MQNDRKEDAVEQDTLVCNPDTSQDKYYSTAISVTGDSTTIQYGKPVAELLTPDQVRILAEKVGCIFVTTH